jgi:predicted  nucleic acid-binding Zn-ribbon protein
MPALYRPHAEAGTSGRPTTQHQQQALQQEQQEQAQLTKLVLKQQNQLGDLEQQVQTLQAAVCKLDASAPGCKARP